MARNNKRTRSPKEITKRINKFFDFINIGDVVVIRKGSTRIRLKVTSKSTEQYCNIYAIHHLTGYMNHSKSWKNRILVTVQVSGDETELTVIRR